MRFCSEGDNITNSNGMNNYGRVQRLHSLCVQTPLMQFSPSLFLCQKDCAETILKPLLATKYFTRSLQRCSLSVEITNDLLQALSTVQSLSELRFFWLSNRHLEIIINTFRSSLDTLTFCNAPLEAEIQVNSPPPPVTKTLRSLIMRKAYTSFASKFIPHFPNLRTLELCCKDASQELDLRPLSSSLSFLAYLRLERCTIDNIESLKNLVHLFSLRFNECSNFELSFLTQENSLPHLAELHIDNCHGLSPSSFASLVHAPNLQVLYLSSNLNFNNDSLQYLGNRHVPEVVDSEFGNGSLQYLENMIHLRRLELSNSKIVGDSRLFKTLMQNLFQLEELNLRGCRVGGRGAIAGSLYSTRSRLRVLNLSYCELVDDDLNGIGALKNTLEVLDLSSNYDLTNEAVVHCKDLVKLKILKLNVCVRIHDLTSLKDCSKLEELEVGHCWILERLDPPPPRS